MRRCRCELSDLVVVCDNLDLPVGAVRLKRNGKSRSHNGLASIMDVLGTGDFTRIYIGIGRPQEGCSVVDHVLGVPTEDETQLYANAVSRAAWAAEALLDRGIETVMNDLNRKP